MMLGCFVNKWRMFKHPLELHLKNTARVFLCATWLHNFCIDQGVVAMDATQNSNSTRHVPSDVNVTSIPGNLMMRDILLEENDFVGQQTMYGGILKV